MSDTRKYDLPPFLEGTLSQESYERWLRRKAQAHVKRDRNRGHGEAAAEGYRLAIHEAVLASEGQDAYTGEKLAWKLISTYDNDHSKEHGGTYKKTLALLPTVDHVGKAQGLMEFAICGWQTHEAKGDLTLEAFSKLCVKVLAHQGYTVAKPS